MMNNARVNMEHAKDMRRYLEETSEKWMKNNMTAISLILYHPVLVGNWVKLSYLQGARDALHYLGTDDEDLPKLRLVPEEGDE